MPPNTRLCSYCNMCDFRGHILPQILHFAVAFTIDILRGQRFSPPKNCERGCKAKPRKGRYSSSRIGWKDVPDKKKRIERLQHPLRFSQARSGVSPGKGHHIQGQKGLTVIPHSLTGTGSNLEME